jgi:hypothetical protein
VKPGRRRIVPRDELGQVCRVNEADADPVLRLAGLNAQWKSFKRAANLYVVSKNARLRAMSLPATVVLRYEPIQRRKARTDE